MFFIDISREVIFKPLSLVRKNAVHTKTRSKLVAALQRHWKQILPEIKLLGLVPNSCIHVSVSDLYIPMIGPPIWLQQYRRTDRGNIYR